METFQYRENELFCEGTSLRAVAEQYGTPLYVYSKNSVIDHCRWIERSFGSTDHLSCYAVKANTNRGILKLLRRGGVAAGK